MGIHGCNELCSMHKGLHYAQRRLLDGEGHEENRAELLLKALKVEVTEDIEMIEVLESLL